MFDSKILGYDILFLKPKFQFEIICTEKKWTWKSISVKTKNTQFMPRKEQNIEIHQNYLLLNVYNILLNFPAFKT